MAGIEGYFMGTTILLGILGGLFSGGLIVGVIEILRYRRELSHWKKEDQKIELTLIQAKQIYLRWETNNYSSDEEKVRLYESGLIGKIESWKFFIMISFSNLTEQDILAIGLNLEQFQPKMVKPKKEDRKYFSGYKRQVLRRYNLLTKQLIEDHELPILIPARGKSGVVFVGDFQYDYPNLVENVPAKFRFVIKTDNCSSQSLDIEPNDDLDFVGEEIDTPEHSDEVHWVGFLDKNCIEHSGPIPF